MKRRAFLELSVTAAGGMTLGFHLPLARAATTPFRANAWIRIDADNTITFTCPRNEMGQDVHTSLALLAAEELDVPVSRLRIEQAGADPAYVNTLLGAQITGGSTSIREAWMPLRQAGAAARMLLLAAAAQRWKVDIASLRAADGFVIGAGDKRLAYGALAATAATLAPPAADTIVLKKPESFRQIGSSTQKRLDTPAKVRGERLFGLDITQPGMLYASLAQCPVIGGSVAKLDASKASAIKGVRAVVDIGEGVAVVADHFWTALKAREALDIEWNFGTGAALSNASVAQALREGSTKPDAVAKQNGDIDAGLRLATQTIEAEYEMPMLAHIALEPINCLARVTSDSCEIWASTQFPQGAQGIAAARSGAAAERTTIHAQFIGGGFGRRLEVEFIGQAAAIARAVPGVPVKLIWTREDDTTHDFYRPASLHKLRGGIGANGELIALDHKMVSHSITERAFPGAVKDGLDPFMAEGAANLTYAVPHLRSSMVIQDTGVRVGFWRSVSNPLNAFAFESFLDELAIAAKADPLTFRLALLDAQPRQAKVLKGAAQMAGWGTLHAADSALGLASMECYGTHIALVAQVARRGADVHCERICVAVDPGIAIRPDQIEAQIQSGVITGLIGTLRNRITFKDGQVQELNFDSFQPLRMSETPRIDVRIMASGDAPGGMGEVGTPLVAPALANAVARLSGKRVRTLPFSEAGVRFV
jgi:isoquinoline 1-oxidoreductase subunit beta